MHARLLRLLFLAFFFSSIAASAEHPSTDSISTAEGPITIHPIEHATFALSWNKKTIYIDPVGGAERFKDLPRPDVILVTDIHGDHMDANTLKGLVGDNTVLLAPPAVVEKLPRRLRKLAMPIPNEMAMLTMGMQVQAVPMYNLTPERLQFHNKGRGNGYLITLGEKRLYVSGDTEDIPEMRALKNIDAAFVCMNLPYTMTVEQAASAVREFKPKIVYPYHYRGTGGMSDVAKFEALVKEEPGIEVRQLNWYPTK